MAISAVHLNPSNARWMPGPEKFLLLQEKTSSASPAMAAADQDRNHSLLISNRPTTRAVFGGGWLVNPICALSVTLHTHKFPTPMWAWTESAILITEINFISPHWARAGLGSGSSGTTAAAARSAIYEIRFYKLFRNVFLCIIFQINAPFHVAYILQTSRRFYLVARADLGCPRAWRGGRGVSRVVGYPSGMKCHFSSFLERSNKVQAIMLPAFCF